MGILCVMRKRIWLKDFCSFNSVSSMFEVISVYISEYAIDFTDDCLTGSLIEDIKGVLFP